MLFYVTCGDKTKTGERAGQGLPVQNSESKQAFPLSAYYLRYSMYLLTTLYIVTLYACTPTSSLPPIYLPITMLFSLPLFAMQTEALEILTCPEGTQFLPLPWFSPDMLKSSILQYKY